MSNNKPEPAVWAGSDLRTKKDVGTFHITSGRAMVSDPYYEEGVWCQHLLTNVANGEWHAYVVISDEGDWGHRVAELVAWIGDEPLEREYEFDNSIVIGVDSANVGIFDHDGFRSLCHFEGYDWTRISGEGPDKEREWILNPGQAYKDPEQNTEEWKIWWEACYAALHGLNRDEETPYGAAVIPDGVITSTGFGDGGYPLFVRHDIEMRVSAIRVVFIVPDDEDE